jgi:DNA-directed RNA polymerase subunit M/transcription elongation factor TFIIS
LGIYTYIGDYYVISIKILRHARGKTQKRGSCSQEQRRILFLIGQKRDRVIEKTKQTITSLSMKPSILDEIKTITAKACPRCQNKLFYFYDAPEGEGFESHGFTCPKCTHSLTIPIFWLQVRRNASNRKRPRHRS